MKWGQNEGKGERLWLSISGINKEINRSAQYWANLTTLQNNSEMEGWRGQVLNTKIWPCITTLKLSLTHCVAVVPAGGSLPVCAACKQRIYDEQYLQALNSDWHAICFRYVTEIKHPCHKLCLFI